MIQDRIALRYATSLYDLAREKSLLEPVLADFRSLARLVRESRDLAIFLSSPVISHARKAEVAGKLFDGKLSPVVLEFIQLMCRRGREALLPQVANTFIALYNKAHGVSVAKLVFAHQPGPAELQSLVKKLETELKTTVETQVAVQPELLGGFVLQVSDKLYDGSLAYRLRKLRQGLTNESLTYTEQL